MLATRDSRDAGDAGLSAAGLAEDGGRKAGAGSVWSCGGGVDELCAEAAFGTTGSCWEDLSLGCRFIMLEELCRGTMEVWAPGIPLESASRPSDVESSLLVR